VQLSRSISLAAERLQSMVFAFGAARTFGAGYLQALRYAVRYRKP
jgi:hypothetical protein